tara:strand:- start:116 stop:835 length:720 start_codon:yes stop_codon:yes gene_type:complete
LYIALLYFAFPHKHFESIVIVATVSLFAIPLFVFVVLNRYFKKIHNEKLFNSGFELYKPELLDPEHRVVCEKTELGFYNQPCRVAFLGSYKGRRVLMSEHLSWGPNYLRLSTRWAVWTPFTLPYALVGPKSVWVNYKRTLGVERFDNVRSLSTQHEREIRDLLIPLIDWFVPQSNDQFAPRGFRYSSKREGWIFDGHWVILADYGHTDADSMILMAEFLVAFVEQLEKRHESLTLQNKS